MIGEKTEQFQNKGTDLSALQGKIEDYLKSEGFTTQSSAPSSEGVVIQAKKGGFLRDVVDADRALSISITGQPNDFTVKVGIGKWLQHLGIAAIRDAAHLRPLPRRRPRRDGLELRGRGQDHRPDQVLHRLAGGRFRGFLGRCREHARSVLCPAPEEVDREGQRRPRATRSTRTVRTPSACCIGQVWTAADGFGLPQS